MKYRKKPIVIEAFQYGKEKAPWWFTKAVNDGLVILDKTFCGISTLEGLMIANEGDYIIQGVRGELYPCKADIFDKTYEKVAYAVLD